MRQFDVTGMSCAACQVRVEKAVSKVPGVTSCAVSLLTNSMSVEGGASDEAIVRAVTDAGYGASPKSAAARTDAASEDALADRETPVLKKRLFISLGFLLLLMYFSMGVRMRGLPMLPFFSENPVAEGLTELLLSAAVMIINQKFFVSGFKSLFHGAPNMDTLVAMGSSVSFLWSTYALFMTADAVYKDGTAAAMLWTEQFWFESAAMILVLITVGKLLEAKSKGRTTDALKALMRLSPETAVLIRDGQEVIVPAAELRKGDIFIVRPGEHIPADAVILDGHTAVNEASLTGESIPADKAPGDTVYTATVNQSGFIRCEALRVGEDTALSKIIEMVNNAAATKAPIAKTADLVSGVFVPAVIGIAAVTLIVWLCIGRPFDFALARAVSVLVISCPCALGLATPVAVMVGNGVGAKQGVLFKTAVSLEETGKIQIAVLDKTGTVTRGEPEVTAVCASADVSENELFETACSLEIKSEHPLARAIVREAKRRNIAARDLTDFKALPGSGLTAVRGNDRLIGGSVSFMMTGRPADPVLCKFAEDIAGRGQTPLVFSKNDRLLGIIAVADTVREESREAVAALRKMGVQVVMLTGDNARTAKAVGEAAGIGHVIAGVLPDGKEAVIRKLRTLGKVAMIGDGINDAPALTAADMGIAIGAGTDAAIDAADVVLMKSLLSDVPAAIRLSRATLKNIRENLFWAFFYNALCIPLAAGVYIGLFSWALNPMIGAAAMSLSSVSVVSNALRLNLFGMHSDKKDRTLKNALPDEALRPVIEAFNLKTEDKKMTKTMKIDGMMCVHCEARVKKALEAIGGVESAEVSHEAGTAVVTLSENVADEALKAAVEAEDYAVLGIE